MLTPDGSRALVHYLVRGGERMGMNEISCLAIQIRRRSFQFCSSPPFRPHQDAHTNAVVANSTSRRSEGHCDGDLPNGDHCDLAAAAPPSPACSRSVRRFIHTHASRRKQALQRQQRRRRRHLKPRTHDQGSPGDERSARGTSSVYMAGDLDSCERDEHEPGRISNAAAEAAWTKNSVSNGDGFFPPLLKTGSASAFDPAA